MDIPQAEAKARSVRRRVLEMISGAGRGHIGGSFSATDILVALYHGKLLRFNPQEPKWDQRDRFILSKGHSSEALYAVLSDVGYFDAEILQGYGESGNMLGCHPDHFVPGIEVSTGSLGHGLGIGAGLALGAKLDGSDMRCVVLLGDGECYEGSVWESAMFGAHHNLNNLVAIIDRNGQITLDRNEDINQQEPFADKWKSFGWETLEIDGHSFQALFDAWEHITQRKSDRPIALIAKTKKGKGVSFMEGDLHWHHNVPKGEQLTMAREELSVDV
jgi:transketolase